MLFWFQLSNEKQLSIMNKVKNGEMSIEDALDQARKDCDQMSQQAEEVQHQTFKASSIFSVQQNVPGEQGALD